MLSKARLRGVFNLLTALNNDLNHFYVGDRLRKNFELTVQSRTIFQSFPITRETHLPSMNRMIHFLLKTYMVENSRHYTHIWSVYVPHFSNWTCTITNWMYFRNFTFLWTPSPTHATDEASPITRKWYLPKSKQLYAQYHLWNPITKVENTVQFSIIAYMYTLEQERAILPTTYNYVIWLCYADDYHKMYVQFIAVPNFLNVLLPW